MAGEEAEKSTTTTTNNTIESAEACAVVSDSGAEKGVENSTTETPNNTVESAEVSAVVSDPGPEKGVENSTTETPSNTVEPTEVSAVVSDSGPEKGVENSTTATSSNAVGSAEASAVVSDSRAEKGVENSTTATSSNAVGSAEVSAVVSDSGAEKGVENSTTATSSNAVGSAEVSAVVSGSGAEKGVEDKEVSQELTAGTLPETGNATTIAATNAGAATSEAAVIAGEAPAAEESKSEPQKAAEEQQKDAKLPPIQALWADAQAHSYKEIWGVTLADPATHVPSQIIFQKYLNANDGDLAKAKEQLKATLDWRAKAKPLALIEKKYPSDKFAGLGYITTYTGEANSAESKEVFTWNIYGVVTDIQKSFGDLDAFIEWRVALMEMAIKELDLANATAPITAENDPYKMFQVHDYKGTSFFRSPPQVRSAAKKTVEVLATAYPETLKEKFFVNVPAVMGFMYAIMKVFVAPKTAKKFHPMSNGAGLVHEFGDSKIAGLGEKLPKEYGGKGDELSKIAKQPLLE